MSENEMTSIINTLEHKLDDMFKQSIAKDVERNANEIEKIKTDNKNRDREINKIKDETTKNTTKIESVKEDTDLIKKLVIIQIAGGLIVGLLLGGN